MEKTGVPQKIATLIRQVVESEELELVDIEYKSGRKSLLRIFISKIGGVTLSDCKKISLLLGELIDTQNLIEEKYLMEVSSPGLDRPLKNKEDYQRNVGNLVKIFLCTPLEDNKTFVGWIISAHDEKIILKEKSGLIANIPIANISRGQLEIEF